MEHIIEIDNERTFLTITIVDTFGERESSYIKKNVLEASAKINCISIDLKDIGDVSIAGVQCCHSLKDYCRRKKIDLNIKCQLSQQASQIINNCGLADALNLNK